jgi:hypothetical protein
MTHAEFRELLRHYHYSNGHDIGIEKAFCELRMEFDMLPDIGAELEEIEKKKVKWHNRIIEKNRIWRKKYRDWYHNLHEKHEDICRSLYAREQGEADRLEELEKALHHDLSTTIRDSEYRFGCADGIQHALNKIKELSNGK